MLKKTPLKSKNNKLKATPLKSGSRGLKVYSSFKKTGNFRILTFTSRSVPLKKTTTLKNKGTELAKTGELKKQNEKSKSKWLTVREEALIRDNHKCVVCGKPATQVHHIHLRSKRKDLVFEINNLVSLCDKHHNHISTDGLYKVNERIAMAKHITLEELLKFAETKQEDEEEKK